MIGVGFEPAGWFRGAVQVSLAERQQGIPDVAEPRMRAGRRAGDTRVPGAAEPARTAAMKLLKETYISWGAEVVLITSNMGGNRGARESGDKLERETLLGY
ncbi:hypothetical protein C8F04DRAFT_1179059 [Mycena alexandri]|uniref:Uncharacterized protein n=1 Tax=Mycena alexandri TaxID=1745969 RepID=A0AAD6T598_9AGAR|nr:hypothetical protein C8F04DRAFT_1179059 [Mycena alexandri]